jgi:hypothetical protein
VARWVNKKSLAPPQELQIGWSMLQFGSLPFAGGVLDQPYSLMLRIRSALNFETIYKDWKNLNAKGLFDWAVKNPDLLTVIMNVEKELKDG